MSIRSLRQTGLFLCIALMSFASTPVHAFDSRFYTGNDVLYYNPDSASCVLAEVSEVGEAGVVAVDTGFSLGNDNAKRPVELANKLMSDYNLKDFQAAGIVGNFMRESGDSLPPDINEGGRRGPPAFKGGYGWAQWTGGRQTTFVNFSISKGFMKRGQAATDAANYAYLNQELTRTSESAAIPALKKTRNVSEATSSWEEKFERAGVVAGEDRISRAKRVLAGMKGSGSVEGVSGDSTEVTGTGTDAVNCEGSNTAVETQSATFDNIAFPLLGGKSVVKNPNIFNNNTTDRGGHPYIAYDIYAPAKTRVVAFTSGTVTNTSHSSSLGQSVTVYNEKSGLAIYYTHMNPNGYAKKGTTVNPGDPIGNLASVNTYPSINVDHLHIDASAGQYRVACSRSSCSASAKSKFRDIGPDLYKAYQELN